MYRVYEQKSSRQISLHVCTVFISFLNFSNHEGSSDRIPRQVQKLRNPSRKENSDLFNESNVVSIYIANKWGAGDR